jgi:hypothetical protein
MKELSVKKGFSFPLSRLSQDNRLFHAIMWELPGVEIGCHQLSQANC